MKSSKAGKTLVVGLIVLLANSGIVSGAETPRIAPAQSTAGKITDGLQLIAWLDKTTVDAGKPIVIHFALRNVRGEDVALVQHLDNLPERDFYFEVKNAQDKPVPLTEYGKLVPNLLACERIKVPIKSGQEIRNQLSINRLHNMTGRGNYSVIVRAYLLDGKREGKTELHPVSPLDAQQPLTFRLASNPVQIEVTQPHRKP